MEEMYEMNKKFLVLENELNVMKDAWLHPKSISSIFGESNQLQGQLISDPAGVCNSPKPFMTQDEENLGTESDSEGGFKNYRDGSCLLAYEIPSNFVGFGKIESEGGEDQFIHGKPLNSDKCRAINRIPAANPTSYKSVIPYERAAKPLVELRNRFTVMDLPKQGLTHIAQTDLFGAPWLLCTELDDVGKMLNMGWLDGSQIATYCK
ncbi:hypothetical protein ACFE04_004511 [Oxalis oulophora]